MRIDLDQSLLSERQGLVEFVSQQQEIAFRSFGPRISRARLRLRRINSVRKHVNFVAELTVVTPYGPVSVRTQHNDAKECLALAFARSRRAIIRQLNLQPALRALPSRR